MKRLFIVLPATVAALTLPQLVSAQTSAPVGNNPLKAGVYIEGMFGANFQGETDIDFEDPNVVDASIDPNVGPLGGLAVGFNLPLGQMNMRFEGELSGRTNEIEELELDNGAVIDEDDSSTSSIAGMANAHLDFYVLPNLAIAAGGGIGSASVTLDIENLVDDDAIAFAYQARLGARYSFSQSATLSLGYTYFATTELEVDDDDNEEITFDYTNHGVHLGLAYLF